MDLRIRHYALSLAAVGLLVGATNAHPNSVSGEAFGISVNAAGVTVGPTPHVVLPPDGGMVSDQLLKYHRAQSRGIDYPGSRHHRIDRAQHRQRPEQRIGGECEPSQRSRQSRIVVAMSSSTANGSRATSTSEGSTLIGLSINGSPPVDVAPSPTRRSRSRRRP